MCRALTSEKDEDLPGSSEHDFTRLATSPSDVSLFCRVTLLNVIPNEFWGISKEGEDNKNSIMQRVDQFVHLRKYETFSLHNVFQGIKVGWHATFTPQLILTASAKSDHVVELSALRSIKSGCCFGSAEASRNLLRILVLRL